MADSHKARVNDHKLALVTGGSGYLGSAIVAHFKERNFFPVIIEHKNGTDVTDAYTLHTTIAAAVKKYGPVYACVHAAAAPLERKSLLSISPESFDKSLAVAARGAYLLAKTAAPHFASSAVFVGLTTEAIEPNRSVSPVGAYLPAKYALRGVLRALSAELPQKVYAVAPGFLPGGLNADLPEAERLRLAQQFNSPTPQEVAALVVELCEGPFTIPTGSSVLVNRSYTPL